MRLMFPGALLGLMLPAVTAFVTIPRLSQLQPRLEIRTLAQSLDEWVIFILAMQRFQAAPDTRLDSYFQICGIHGSPHIYWDNNPRVQPAVADRNMGYCFHGTEHFYLWHRPYLALFEQAIINNAKAIAATYRDPWLRAKYVTAADRLRLPYWDWAAYPGMPSQLTDATVEVEDPASGRTVRIPNPLLNYRFKNPRASPFLSVTTRSPGYEQGMRNVYGQLRQNVALLFNTPNVCWNVFATYAENEHDQCGNQPVVNSLEAVHNTIHNTICATMCNLQLAAFDVVFWLHHANVDRLGALWQALNPNTFISRTFSTVTTYVQRPGFVDANTPLHPFHLDQNRWWTSAACRDVQSLGYTYIELNGRFANANALRSAVQQRVNALYGTGRSLQRFASASAARMKQKRGTQTSPPDLISATRVEEKFEPSTNNLGSPPNFASLQKISRTLISSNGSFGDYTARISVNRAKFPSTFAVHLYFGEPDRPAAVTSSTNRIGSFSVLTVPGMMDKVVTGVIILTDALLNQIVRGSVRDMNVGTVRSYCRGNLKYRVVGADGKDYTQTAQGAGLKINVYRSEVTPEGDDAAPVVAGSNSILEFAAAGRSWT